MANYTGGGRNTAKNRQREPESRPHFRTPFTSSGIAIHRKVEAYNAPRAPTFDLRHAGNAPFEVPLHDKAPLQSPSNRIDSIPSTAWELEDSNQVDSPKRFSIDHTTPSNYDDPRKRVLARLHNGGLLCLPPKGQKHEHPSLKRPCDSLISPGSPPMPPLKRLKHEPPPSSETTSYYVSDIHVGHKDQTGDGKGYHSSLQERNARPATPEPPHNVDEDDEILSFGSTPPTALNYDDFDHKQLEMPDETFSPNPFLTPGSGNSSLIGSKTYSEAFFDPDSIEDYDNYFDHTAESERESFAGTVLDTWPEIPISRSPPERIRLPGDRTGVGLPLKRWAGDGLEEINDVGLFPTNCWMDSDSENEEEILLAKNWLESPYEESLFYQQANEKGDQAELAVIHAAMEMTEMSGIYTVVGTPIELTATAQDSKDEMDLSTVELTGGTLVNEEYDPSEIEDVVFHVIPAPVEDEEVFVIAPNLFD